MVKKLFACVVVCILLVNFLLFIFLKISALTFWIIIFICAVVAYKVLPKIKEKKYL